MSGQATTSDRADPTGIMRYLLRYHALSMDSSFFTATVIPMERADMTEHKAVIESAICHSRINLCQPGLRVRQPKKKNW